MSPRKARPLLQAKSLHSLPEQTVGHTRQILHAFTGPDGNNPTGGLIADQAGNLYGTTIHGSANNAGVVSELSPASGGTWNETVLYSFGSRGDGLSPVGPLVFDAAGNLYGTTIEGGGTGYQGTVFVLKPTANGWVETILHRFNQSSGDGFLPQSGVSFDASGNLYGTTYEGGLYRQGVAYKLTPNENGRYTESALHTFGSGPDGAQPVAAPILDPAGNLYGTTTSGGNGSNPMATEQSSR